jgi:hypothetical protein
MTATKAARIRTIAGLVIHVLIGAILIMAGSFKLFGTMPPEAIDQLQKSGLLEDLKLIGTGELITAITLIIPWTSSLGVLLASGFWGGVIATHMATDGQIAAGSVFLALTWLGGWLRNPELLASFRRKRPADPTP